MKFRIRNSKGVLVTDAFVAPNGKAYVEGFMGMSELKDASVELLVGKDNLGKNVYESDILLSEYSVYTAGFDLDMGAVLILENGSKIPFKQCCEKLVLKEIE